LASYLPRIFKVTEAPSSVLIALTSRGASDFVSIAFNGAVTTGSANSRRTHVGRDWAGGRPPAPSTLAPTLTPALPRGSQDSSGAADWRSRGFQGRELLLRRIGRKDANKPVVGPSFLGLFFTVASHWDAWQTTAAGLPCSDPRPWRLGSRWSSDIPDGVEESATP